MEVNIRIKDTNYIRNRFITNVHGSVYYITSKLILINYNRFIIDYKGRLNYIVDGYVKEIVDCNNFNPELSPDDHIEIVKSITLINTVCGLKLEICSFDRHTYDLLIKVSSSVFMEIKSEWTIINRNKELDKVLQD